ncbi:MAG: hypothetical protein GWN62_00650, partial [Aliifodinibius sp.]|nr:hypothetical protein [Nitrosopumilaceae archaeon]NIV09846.1 hypothetical protein [Fodinibius sp.]NIX61818.1 hypothetical protein [Nitrosopumilaceae archaeon]
DRDVDLAVANFSSNDVMVFQNIGNGTFLPNDTIMVETGPRNLTGLDVSGTQGRIDLITVNLIQQDVSLLRNIDLSNNPPVVINQINDVIYEEDSGPHIVIDDLNTVFSDTLD